jgi:GT2 family glycosyltransferase
MRSGEYAVMLNNDIAVITPDWLEQMLAYAQLSHVGSVGALLYYPDNTIQHGRCHNRKRRRLGAIGITASRQMSKDYMHVTLTIPNDVACCTAACLMISKKKYEEVHGMNERT